MRSTRKEKQREKVFREILKGRGDDITRPIIVFPFPLREREKTELCIHRYGTCCTTRGVNNKKIIIIIIIITKQIK